MNHNILKTLDYISSLLIPLFILFVIISAIFSRKAKAYESFIKGAMEGPQIVLRIFPYILAIFVAIKTFQSSGAFDFLKEIFATSSVGKFLAVPPEVFSISIIKPLSGSASLGIFTEIVKNSGPDSMASRMSAIIMGSAETTFYVLAVYLGAAGIKKTKYLVPVCLIADGVGIIIAILVSKIFFN